MIFLFIFPLILFTIVFLFIYKYNKINSIIIPLVSGLIGSIVLNFALVGIDYSIKTNDQEIRSGTVIEAFHKDAWDEWHPPRQYKDSNGKIKTKPGYWEHHNAINQITTSDYGNISVYETPDGKKINDDYPKTVDELYNYWSIGMPTASVHQYRNYIQTSNSIYKHDNIDWKQYELPDYPLKVENYVTINRALGEFPNKESVNKKLNEWNSYLNHMIIKENGKKGSYKEVNVIFVNLGENTSLDWGFALQEKFENGNKNDFIVSFGTDGGKISWCYPFSWSESEITKARVKNIVLDGDFNNFAQIIDDSCKEIENSFVRKEMKDFEYIKIVPSSYVYIVSVIVNLIVCVMILLCIKEYIKQI